MEHVFYNFKCNYRKYLMNTLNTEKIKLIKRKQTSGFFINP